MKKAMRAGAVLLFVCLMMTGCAANSAMPSPTATPPLTAPPETTQGAANPEVFVPVGKIAEIFIGTTKVVGSAYYIGEAQNTMAFPMVEVGRALGWTVLEPKNAGAVETRVNKDGGELVIIKYTLPTIDFTGTIEDISLTKGGRAVDVGGSKQVMIDGTLHVTKEFIEKALEDIEITYDGETKITIAPKTAA